MKRKLVIFTTSLSGGVLKKLAEATGDDPVTTWLTPIIAGKRYDPRYDWFEITPAMISSMERHFKARATKLDVPLKFGHYGDGRAAGWFKDLKAEGNRLRALVEWTPPGIEAVKNKEFKYLSAEYDEDYQDNETGTRIGCVFEACILTNSPVIRDQEPLMLSRKLDADDEVRVVFHPELEKELSTDQHHEEEKPVDPKKYLAAIMLGCGLPDEAVKRLGAEIEKKLTDKSTEDEVKKLAMDAIASERKALSTPPPPAKQPDPVPAPATDSAKYLSAADAEDMFTKRLASEKKKETERETRRLSRISEFGKRLSDQQGLDEDTRKTLSASFGSFITGDTPEDMVTAYSDSVLATAEKQIANAKLLAMGFAPQGVTVLKDGDDKKMLAFRDFVDEHLLSKKPAEIRYPESRGKVTPGAASFRDRYLARYDQIHARELVEDGKRFLSGGQSGTSDTPIGSGGLVSINRQVIYEALSDMAILDIIQTDIADNINSTTVEIYYESRSPNARPPMNVYEKGAVNYAGVSLASESFYVTPKKLATKLSNELMFFSRRAGINWNAVDRNLGMLIQHRKELMTGLLVNELVLANDEYTATAVVAEDLGAQCDGAHYTFQLANYPLVPPRVTKDIKGTTKSTANAITITYDGVARTMYDGSGTQATGTYWKPINWALGQFQIITISTQGVPLSGIAEVYAVVIPAALKTLTASHYYTTNVAIFDTKYTSGQWDEHLNGLLQLFGAVKAGHYQDRKVQPDFAFMAETLNDTISNAKNFAPSLRTEGQGLGASGNLQKIKGVPCYGSNALGDYLSENRLIIGQRGNTGFSVVKPFQQEGTWEQVVNSSGQFTGEQQTYFEEYSAIGTPTAVKNRCQSILVRHSDDDIGPFPH